MARPADDLNVVPVGVQHDNDAGEPPRSGHRASRLGCGLVALACFGVVATLIMMLAVAVVPFPCESFEAICGKQDLVAYMPMIATIVGVVGAAIGGGIALRRRRSTGLWVLGAWLLVFAGCGYSCSVLSAEPDTAARNAKTAAEREQRIAAMRARPAFETVKARYRQMHQQLADAAAAAVPGMSWPSEDALLDGSRSGCDRDTPHGRGYRGTGAASITGKTVITEPQWTALEAALREVAGRYGFTGPPSHRRTGPGDPQPPGFVWTSREGARIEGYLMRFDHGLSLSFDTPCFLPKAQR